MAATYFTSFCFSAHSTRGNAPFWSLRGSLVLFRDSNKRANTLLKNRTKPPPPPPFLICTLTFSLVLYHSPLSFFSLQPPYNFPVPECAACRELRFCEEEWAVPVRLQNLPRDCPRLVRPGHRSQRLDRGVDQWGLCDLFGGHNLGRGTKGKVEQRRQMKWTSNCPSKVDL